jgi:hypothetical protein
MLAMYRLASVFVVMVASAFACTRRPTVYAVSRSFSVHLSNEFGPVVGLKVKVVRLKWEEFNKLSNEQLRYLSDTSRFEEVVGESTTDVRGIAHFSLDKTGSFTLMVDSPADQLGWIELRVSDQSESSPLEVKWPSNLILKSTRLQGKITDGLFSSRSVPLKGHGLMLHTLIGYRDVAARVTDEDGAFDFNTVAPGFYFLQILPTSAKTNDSYEPEGNIVVYVAPESPPDVLTISTVFTSCGLSYDLEENKARYKPTACFKGDKQVKCEY